MIDTPKLIDPALHNLIEEQRQYIQALPGHFAPPLSSAPAPLPASDLTIPSTFSPTPLGVRIVKPTGDIHGVYLHIHGGGFMHGDAKMGDAANSALAHDLGLATVSIDYRLAPAHPHPAAVDDCVSAARWLIENCNVEFGVNRLLIGGESVGASLAVLTLLKLRDLNGLQQKFCAANLVVGNYDFSMTPSQRAATDAHFLSPQHLAEMRAAVFPNKYSEELRDPAISSLYADLRHMPAALFTVGTADSVVDDSIFMAARWQLAGNETQLAVYPQAPHLFMTYQTQMAAAARQRIREFMRHYLMHTA